MSVVAQAFDLRQILMSMSKINWEVKDVMSQHNPYIDMILRVGMCLVIKIVWVEFVLGSSHFHFAVGRCSNESSYFSWGL